jgi:hypothetical protein
MGWTSVGSVMVQEVQGHVRGRVLCGRYCGPSCGGGGCRGAGRWVSLNLASWVCRVGGGVAVALSGSRLVLVSGAVVLAVASPLAFTLGSAALGDAVSGSVIAATAVAALAVPLWPSRTDGAEPDGEESEGAVARRTGRAQAGGGGDANSGVRLRPGTRGPLRAGTGPGDDGWSTRGAGRHHRGSSQAKSRNRNDLEAVSGGFRAAPPDCWAPR